MNRFLELLHRTDKRFGIAAQGLNRPSPLVEIAYRHSGTIRHVFQVRRFDDEVLHRIPSGIQADGDAGKLGNPLQKAFDRLFGLVQLLDLLEANRFEYDSKLFNDNHRVLFAFSA